MAHNFDTSRYRVCIYRTISEPHYLAVDIENSTSGSYDKAYFGNKQYIYKKVWFFPAPRKAIYSSILWGIITCNNIKPVTGIIPKANPTNRSIYDLPDDKYAIIENLINSIVELFSTISKSRELIDIIVNDGAADELMQLAPESTRSISDSNASMFRFDKKNPSALFVSNRAKIPVIVSLNHPESH